MAETQCAPIARKGDEVTHTKTNAFAVVGTEVGVSISILLAILTGGESAEVEATFFAELAEGSEILSFIFESCEFLDMAGDVIGAAGTVAGWAARYFNAPAPSGHIKEGSPNVLAGSQPVSRMTDLLECHESTAGTVLLCAGAIITFPLGMVMLGVLALHQSVRTLEYNSMASDGPIIPVYTHVHSDIVLAAETVLTNGLPTARITSLGQCGSTVSKGLDTVQVGGPDGAQAGESGSEVDSWLASGLSGLSWITTGAGAIMKLPWEISLGVSKLFVKEAVREGLMDEKTAKILDFALTAAGGVSSLRKAMVTGVKLGDAVDENLKTEKEKPKETDWRKMREDRENPPKPPTKSTEQGFREMREKNNQGDKSGHF